MPALPATSMPDSGLSINARLLVEGDEWWADIPLLSANGLPTAFSHIVARSFVGMPCHHSLRKAGFLYTAFQSGTISASQRARFSSMAFSRAILRSCKAFLRFSATKVQFGYVFASWEAHLLSDFVSSCFATPIDAYYLPPWTLAAGM
jgi:hypothetical protein